MQTPTVDATVSGWLRHFASADRTIQAEGRWLSAETELAHEIAPGVILAGRVDAIGTDFFGEWKTMNPRAKTGWREKWRFHPQTLTYGLLRHLCIPSKANRFTIRIAFKSDPPSYDHEWFSYSDAEIETWRREVLHIAHQIQYNIATTGPDKHWPLNPLSCYKYGPSYPCAYVRACHSSQFDIPIAGLIPRVPHLVTETQNPSKIVIDATRITEYLECPEQFRRVYIRREVEPNSEALNFGSQFHELLGEYYKRLAAGEVYDLTGVNVTWP